jgi:Flp pilus assembly protein TadD
VSLKWLERAVALDPSYPEPRYLLGQTYRRLGRADDAERELTVFRELLARGPASARR